jgi:ribosomal-protein-alanine N-acetyltransferase
MRGPTDPDKPTPARCGTTVYIRRPTAGDEAEWTALRAASAGFLEPWEPVPDLGPDESPFDRMLERASTERSHRFMICEVASGAIAGQISLNEIIRGALQQAFVGYWIGLPFARRGFMTEALRLTVAHAFDTVKLHRLEANIQPHNLASIALARKVGFRREGFSPSYLKIAGAWADHERWAITAEQWAAAGPDLPAG